MELIKLLRKSRFNLRYLPNNTNNVENVLRSRVLQRMLQEPRDDEVQGGQSTRALEQHVDAVGPWCLHSEHEQFRRSVDKTVTNYYHSTGIDRPLWLVLSQP